jgi:hypothetical protein
MWLNLEIINGVCLKMRDLFKSVMVGRFVVRCFCISRAFPASSLPIALCRHMEAILAL